MMANIYILKNEYINITTNLTQTKKLIGEYYEQLYANKIDNLDKKEKFPEIYK